MTKHIFIATPAYSGTVHVQYTISFAQTVCALLSKGHKVTPYIEAGGSLLIATRNRILQLFLESEATHLLCIDSDLGWPAEAVLAMLEENKDFVCGVYPSRNGENVFLYRPVLDKDNNLITDRHLIKAEYIPAGFMLLSRRAVQQMVSKFPEKVCAPKIGTNAHLKFCSLFETEVYEGEFWGEDYVFCRRAREAGIDIWIDPLIQFDHAGRMGTLVETLTPVTEEL
jgi:hypothetical protein